MKHTLLSAQEFVVRREQLFKKMPINSIAVISANKEVTRSNDTEFSFCQHKNFYYLTGFNEPEAILVMLKGAEQDAGKVFEQSILFCLDKDPLQEVWHGRRVGFELAKIDYGFEQSYPLSELTDKIMPLLENKSQLWCCFTDNNSFEQQVHVWLEQAKSKKRQGINAPNTLVDCTDILAEMRLIKTTAELAIMRQANVISGLAHQRAMQQTREGKFEYQIEADILHEFASHGARYPAYGTIVASGDNANILHYTNNEQALFAGDLLLIDAGCELAGYAADITRTFPVNGVFSAEQKVLYQLVLDAQNLAIAAIKPKVTFADLNKIVGEFFTTQLHVLSILTGDLPKLITENACKKYFIHGLGHWLGLDVHDVGDYQVNPDNKKEQRRVFEKGMVMTIEPGLYIPLSDLEVDVKWRGIGIRIEDNIVVTDQGHENLTENTPKSIDEIETLMAKND